MFLAFLTFGQALSSFASKLPWQAWASLAIIASLGMGGWYIDRNAFSRGVSESNKEWVARVEAEVLRQMNANNKALEIAQREVERLNEAKEVRDAHIERLDREALEAVNARRECLDANSVRRLDLGD